MKVSRKILLLLVAGTLALVGNVYAGVFLFTVVEDVEVIVHPRGYDGTPGELVVTVCVDPESEARDELVIPLENAIRTWNRLDATIGNWSVGSENNVPGDQIDVESILLHEVGHCIGLGHPNLDTSSGVASNQRGYTNADRGPNGAWDLDRGPDGVQGSFDDVRGDDINRHWFARAHNNPFVLENVVDPSTYSVHLQALPQGHGFAANANRQVGASLGFPQSESVMRQGISPSTATRELAADDVAMIRLAQTGLDRTQGTEWDYKMVLEFVGVSGDCDINVKMGGTGFANCTSGGVPVESEVGTHFALLSPRIRLGSTANFNWFFNDVSNAHRCDDPDIIFCDRFEGPDPTPIPEPSPSCPAGNVGPGAQPNGTVPGELSFPHPTIRNATILWEITGDENADGVVTVRFRKEGATVWRRGMPLRRAVAGSLAGHTWTDRHS
ncbi:MAG: hypothetical protein ACNA8W_11875, partial [Bradymonadaceae bacterium]